MGHNKWEDDHERQITTEEQESPVFKRGWVLQERLLSPRVLYFGRYRMYWECNKHCRYGNFLQPWSCFSKIGHQGLAKPQFAKSINLKGFRLWHSLVAIKGEKRRNLQKEDHRLWYSLIEDYTNRSLTVASDKLPALSGIASLLWGPDSDNYVASLGKDDIHAGLAWYVPSTHRAKASQQENNTNWIAPTWSWASQRRPVVFDVAISASSSRIRPRLLAVDVKLAGSNPFG